MENGMEEEASESNQNEDVEFLNSDDKGSSLLMGSGGGQKRRFRVGLTSANSFKQHNSLLSKDDLDLLLILAKSADFFLYNLKILSTILFFNINPKFSFR